MSFKLEIWVGASGSGLKIITIRRVISEFGSVIAFLYK